MDLTKNIKLKAAIFLIMSFLFLVFGFHDTVKADTNSDVHISYQSHVQNVGWQNAVSDGNTSGTTGRALRLEALKLNLSGDAKGMSVSYQAHVQNIGWMNWTSQGQAAGTTGRALRLEAIKIKLNNAPSNYHVQYQVHVQNIGWTSWVQDGQIAGTTGRALRVEAIRIRIVKPNTSQQQNSVQKLNPRMAIDTPRNNETVSGSSIVVRGWTLNSNTSGVKQVTISVDGNQKGNASIGQPRADVKNVYPGYAGAANSGYSYNLDVSKLSNGNHTVTIKSVGNDGSSIYGSVIIKVNRSSTKTIAVAIDIGHNAPYDSGATGIRQEDEITMEVGQKVISKLQAKGYNVIATKPATADSTVDSLQQRVDAANNGNAELFVSIHANIGGGQGTEVWAGGSQKSIDLAHNILNNMVALGYRNRGVKVQGVDGQHLYVLNNTVMPAVLVETFFLDSQSDMNKYNPEAIANAVVNGIVSTL
ncbi:N-acetylmuramoyl-L-alanine amidase [Clostridium pasteurianum]|uniref:N-acetylmuramoyl-L-alanine amidase n=1 Tax=Clostridium pasteurianum TaxID=1501 RepID=UPI002260B47B|nr:N-acetylmuramoyl-L-alanine amidase [Clostridium pasteurianum]UZW15000.1 N-acetylmuramoyl-L-alanine amidase [Clostridium pasteurianum]